MKLFIQLTTQLMIVLSGLLLMACQQDSNPTTTEATCMKLSAQQAGTQIVEIYRKAMDETNRLTKNQAKPESIEAEFNALLKTWQTELLLIGQHVMVMTGAEQQQIQSAINKEHVAMQYNETAKKRFEDFSKNTFPYHKTSPELYQKLKGINIITQFAFFDLLKKQNKDAEEKWGEWMVPYVCE
ncbi:hypothetical protein [Marinicella gelatinilytica]|uniref:hypothetical protein n=1 Tax=Marinicella gelatinilytica TaxID=2996017 RepID=UPI002260D645|nr:hypothetical protein [Marinicella gelatinilytica]MCX7543849.1 hypothetical protein [Marinicella gelatinilytica]